VRLCVRERETIERKVSVCEREKEVRVCVREVRVRGEGVCVGERCEREVRVCVREREVRKEVSVCVCAREVSECRGWPTAPPSDGRRRSVFARAYSLSLALSPSFVR